MPRRPLEARLRRHVPALTHRPTRVGRVRRPNQSMRIMTAKIAIPRNRRSSHHGRPSMAYWPVRALTRAVAIRASGESGKSSITFR